MDEETRNEPAPDREVFGREEVDPATPDGKGIAWLESAGKIISIHGSLSIGRSPKNTVLVDSPKASRRHAIINIQNIGEFWLIDLGSSNGTFLNGRRTSRPVRLSDLDEIVIGDRMFAFRRPEETEYLPTLAQRTIRQVEDVPSWLLLADIENFTPLTRSMVSDKLATLVGGWVATCNEVIEDCGGIIDKYLGDGFLAYWRDAEDVPASIVKALKALQLAQAKQDPRFRLALHSGSVAVGGMPSMGEESLMGREVNFIFRMEKLASSKGIPLLMSAPAHARIADQFPGRPIGGHELKGFEGAFEFFAC